MELKSLIGLWSFYTDRNLFYCNDKRKGKPFMDFVLVVTVTLMEDWNKAYQ